MRGRASKDSGQRNIAWQGPSPSLCCRKFIQHRQIQRLPPSVRLCPRFIANPNELIPDLNPAKHQDYTRIGAKTVVTKQIVQNRARLCEGAD